MSVYTNCPACEKRIRVRKPGIRILCPYCREKVRIPDVDVPHVVEHLDDDALVNSRPESSSNLLEPAPDNLNGTEPVQTAPVEIPNEFDLIGAAVPVATHVVPVSAMTKQLKKRRALPGVEPPNPFRKKWYQHFLQRQRRILRGDETPSTLPFKLLAVYAMAVTAALVYLLLVPTALRVLRNIGS